MRYSFASKLDSTTMAATQLPGRLVLYAGLRRERLGLILVSEFSSFLLSFGKHDGGSPEIQVVSMAQVFSGVVFTAVFSV